MAERTAVSKVREMTRIAAAGAWAAWQRNRPEPEAQRNGSRQRAALQRARRDLDETVSEAAQVHRKLCAPRQVRRGPFEIASEIFAVRHLAGDFFCVADAGSSTMLAVGDIAGKGMAAGMWVPHLVGLFQVHAGSFPNPAEAMAAINRDLCRLQPIAPLASLFLARLDWRAGEFLYCNAGHPPALVLRAGGAVERLEEGGPMVGALPAAVFGAGRLVLQPGDALLGYSDGLVECRNAAGQEFGVKRLVSEARRTLRPSAGGMLFSILATVRDFTGTRPCEDDLTLMVLSHAGGTPRERQQVW